MSIKFKKINGLKNGFFKRKTKFSKSIPGWFILKPQQRKKEVILHPAKYPEELVEMFVSVFTNENDNVLITKL